MDKVENEFIPLKDKISDMIVTLDSVISSVNEIIDNDFKNNLGKTLGNLNSTTESLDKIIGSKEKELTATLDNVNKFTKMLAENSEKMNSTFSNLKTISDTIAAADIYSTISNLKTSLEKAALLLNNMNNGKGTAGKFLTNDTLYTNLTSSLESLNVLLQDMKANPKRYVHFSIFGKKSVPPK